MKRIALFLYLLFFFFLLNSKSVLAQGTCTANPAFGTLVENKCDSGYEPLVEFSGSGSYSCNCVLSASPKPRYTDPCLNPDKTTFNQNCVGCLGELKDGFRQNATNSSWTALGCISADPQEFVAWLLGAVIGIAGGIVFLLILYGGFQILTSTGDPEKLNNGKEIIVSAIAGLLMIVFSVLLLKIIGVDILKIPGFQ